jgi:hypothetical protein
MSSSDSDREAFNIISNSSDTDSEKTNRRERVFKERVNYLATLDSYEFN